MNRNELRKEINEICYLFQDVLNETKLDKIDGRVEKLEVRKKKLIDKILQSE